MPLHELEHCVESALQPSSAGRTGRRRLGEVAQKLLVRPVHELGVKLALSREVAVQESRGDVCRLGDLLDSRRLVAALGEHRAGGLEQALAPDLRLQTAA